MEDAVFFTLFKALVSLVWVGVNAMGLSRRTPRNHHECTPSHQMNDRKGSVVTGASYTSDRTRNLEAFILGKHALPHNDTFNGLNRYFKLMLVVLEPWYVRPYALVVLAIRMVRE